MTIATRVSAGDDRIDIRDVIERFKDLENDREPEEQHEFEMLEQLLDRIAAHGGDEEWRGDWYPLELISDHTFEEYAQELAEDIGLVDSSAAWPNSYIDWEAAAAALQHDYSSVEFDEVTYWHRSA